MTKEKVEEYKKRLGAVFKDWTKVAEEWVATPDLTEEDFKELRLWLGKHPFNRAMAAIRFAKNRESYGAWFSDSSEIEYVADIIRLLHENSDYFAYFVSEILASNLREELKPGLVNWVVFEYARVAKSRYEREQEDKVRKKCETEKKWWKFW